MRNFWEDDTKLLIGIRRIEFRSLDGLEKKSAMPKMLFLQNGHSANVFAQLSSAQKVQTLISSSFSQTANELPVLPWPGVEPQLLVLFWLGQKQSKDCSFCSEAVPTVLYIISSLHCTPEIYKDEPSHL